MEVNDVIGLITRKEGRISMGGEMLGLPIILHGEGRMCIYEHACQAAVGFTWVC
jgi:hypothetical protein